MENRYNFMNQHKSSSYWRPYRRSEEFQEEDVWGVIRENREVGFKIDETKAPTSPLSISRRLPSAARMITGTLKHQKHNSDEPKLVQHSAPVHIPDWSKIYGKSINRKDGSSSSASPHDREHHDNDYNVFVHEGVGETDEDDEDCNDNNDDDNRLPPHEWLAKRLARSQISSFSVCEGAGRTLKGRDLSRVRNAVLSQTGFI